jgi:hypothetical protein
MALFCNDAVHNRVMSKIRFTSVRQYSVQREHRQPHVLKANVKGNSVATSEFRPLDATLNFNTSHASRRGREPQLKAHSVSFESQNDCTRFYN